MDKEKIKYNIKDDKRQKLFLEILDKFELDNSDQSNEFVNRIFEYVRTVRKDLDDLNVKFKQIIALFKYYGYTEDEIKTIITKSPSILHSDTEKIKEKFCMLYRIVNPKTGKTILLDDFVNNPRILWTSEKVLYARIKYLTSEDCKNFVRHDYLTTRQVCRSTISEFEKSYHINHAELLAKYPYEEEQVKEVMNWFDIKNFRLQQFEKHFNTIKEPLTDDTVKAK